MTRETSPEFQTAAQQARQLTKEPSQSELLELYSNYKQATEDFGTAKAPGTFDFMGKAKYNAWKKLVDAGVTPEDAEKKYIALVDEFKVKYEFDPNKQVAPRK